MTDYPGETRESKGEQLIQAIETRMQGIRKTGGYYSDAGNSVVRGKAEITEITAPGLLIEEVEEEVFNFDNNAQDRYTMNLILRIRDALKDTENPAVRSRQLRDDVLVALGMDETFEARALALDLSKITLIGATDTDGIIVGADVRLSVEYRTNRLDPYN